MANRAEMRVMHAIAKTYGYLPSDLLRLTWAEYQFNAAVLLAGLEEDEPARRPAPPTRNDWSRLAK